MAGIHDYTRNRGKRENKFRLKGEFHNVHNESLVKLPFFFPSCHLTHSFYPIVRNFFNEEDEDIIVITT